MGAGGVTAVGPQFLRPDPRLGERIEERQQVALLVLVPRPGAGARPPRLGAGSGCRPCRGACARPSRPLFRLHQRGIHDHPRPVELLRLGELPLEQPDRLFEEPRRDHSSSRRRHVSPLGKPSSRKGTCNHGVSCRAQRGSPPNTGAGQSESGPDSGNDAADPPTPAPTAPTEHPRHATSTAPNNPDAANPNEQIETP